MDMGYGIACLELLDCLGFGGKKREEFVLGYGKTCLVGKMMGHVYRYRMMLVSRDREKNDKVTERGGIRGDELEVLEGEWRRRYMVGVWSWSWKIIMKKRSREEGRCEGRRCS